MYAIVPTTRSIAINNIVSFIFIYNINYQREVQ